VSRRLLDADGGGVYTNGHLLFIRQTNVIAQPFDAQRLELKGSPFQIADGVFGVAGGQALMLSAAAAAFAFRAGEARFARQFTWVDRAGNQIAIVGDRLGNPDGVSYSPDRSQLVFFERGPTSSDLWMLDTRRGELFLPELRVLRFRLGELQEKVLANRIRFRRGERRVKGRAVELVLKVGSIAPDVRGPGHGAHPT